MWEWTQLQPDLSCFLFEKSIFPSAVSCTSQKHRLWVCVSVLPLSSYVSSDQLPDVSESQVPYSKSGTITGLILTLNDMRSMKCLAQGLPHSASCREVLSLLLIYLPLHPTWSSSWTTGKTLMAVTPLNLQFLQSADGRMPHPPEIGIRVGGRGPKCQARGLLFTWSLSFIS